VIAVVFDGAEITYELSGTSWIRRAGSPPEPLTTAGGEAAWGRDLTEVRAVPAPLQLGSPQYSQQTTIPRRQLTQRTDGTP